MRKELRKCNFLGDVDSLHYLVSIAVVSYPTDVDSVESICALNNNLNISIKASIYFLEEIGLISIDVSNRIIATEFGLSFSNMSVSDFMVKISESVYLYMIENSFINLDSVSYDPITKLCHIKRSGILLTAAVFRNLLIDFGALEETNIGLYRVNELYESLFEASVKKQRPKLTLDELMEKQRKQEEQGRLAEEFVVDYEKVRLQSSSVVDNIKQISDLDVTAGYDILSFEEQNSKDYDRFIEVKSYHMRPQFFWSSNEYETAKKLGSRYYLYLVDMDQYLKPGYQPIIISDPSKIFETGELWFIEAASWKITKI